MSQLFATGKVISNLELKASAKQNLYIDHLFPALDFLHLVQKEIGLSAGAETVF